MKSENDLTGAGHQTPVTFAMPENAKIILTRPDDFILAMHPYERALTMRSGDPVSREAYLTFLGENILPWSELERDKLKTAMRMLDAWLDGSRINARQSIVFIKTTGHEMWNCAYTRSNAVILPEKKLHANAAALARLLAHEYFHILTRQSPRLRTALYRLIGFHPLLGDRFDIPEIVKQRMLTNPDAPHHDHFASLSYRGKSLHALPITMLKQPAVTVDDTQDILSSLMTQLLVIRRKEGGWEIQWQHGRPLCLDLQQVTGWRAYLCDDEETVYDPEEILADRFVRLLAGKKDEPGARISPDMASILSAYLWAEKK